MEMHQLFEVINQVLEDSGRRRIESLVDGHNLRNDLGLDSFRLVELTVRIEDATGIDISSDGVVATIADIRRKLARTVRVEGNALFDTAGIAGTQERGG